MADPARPETIESPVHGRLTRTVALAASLALATIAWATWLVPVTAHADGPSTFFGFIAADERGVLPTRVRAVGRSGAGGVPVVCGTGEITRSGANAGFYTIQVVSASTRAGCFEEGRPVPFLLLYGAVDPGIEAGEGTWRRGAEQHLDLAPGSERAHIGGFVGFLPDLAGYGLLIWRGPDRTPIQHAVRTVGRDVQIAFRIGTWGVQVYIPTVPGIASDLTEVSGDDVVVVRVR